MLSSVIFGDFKKNYENYHIMFTDKYIKQK